MRHQGGCQCGSIRYEVSGEPQHASLCHCIDCRKSAGAPAVAWAAYLEEDFRIIKGQAVTFSSSGLSMRSFCGTCGTGLYFVNAEVLPGIVDIQTATLDDPNAIVMECQIQTAERIEWMADLQGLPEFARWPGM
jgi:hypothetical protein